MKEPVIVLTGPTAVGKTALSIALAKKIGAEIISADSMQVYRHMDIGSAKISVPEMEGVPHHLIDILEPDTPFSAALFKEYAKKAAGEIRARGRIPLVVGGTGFYIQGLLYDIDFGGGTAGSAASADTASYTRVHARLMDILENEGAARIHELLSEADPESAAAIHPNNVKRTIRALEYFENTGERMSDHNRKERSRESPYNYAYFVLDDERRLIYSRIDERVDKMMEAGLLDEVRALKAGGLDRSMVSMQGLGYKELLSYLDGETTLEEAVRIIKRDTRHFAKRQLTWFGREKEVIRIYKPDFGYDDDRMLQFILDECGLRGII